MNGLVPGMPACEVSEEVVRLWSDGETDRKASCAVFNNGSLLAARESRRARTEIRRGTSAEDSMARRVVESPKRNKGESESD